MCTISQYDVLLETVSHTLAKNYSLIDKYCETEIRSNQAELIRIRKKLLQSDLSDINFIELAKQIKKLDITTRPPLVKKQAYAIIKK